MVTLKDLEEKRLFTFDEAISFFKNQESEQSWSRNYLVEGKVSPLDNAPILIEEIKQKFNVSAEVSDDTLKEEIAGRKLLFSFPLKNERQVCIPVGPTAYGSLIQRAGYANSPVLSLLKDKQSQVEMSPTTKAEVLNAGLKCFKNMMLVLVRDEKVRAVLSGDESDYAIFNMSELLETLNTELLLLSPSAEYRTGTASHEYETAVFELNDQKLEESIVETFRKVGIDANGFRPYIKLGTSDVGAAAVTLTPVIINKMGTEKLLGEPIKLTHNNKHNMEDFKKNIEKVFASFRDVNDKLNKLAAVEIKYPDGCLKAIAAKIKLPKKQTLICADEFGAYYSKAKGIDVFWKLYDLLDDYAAEVEMSEFRKINLSEAIFRVVNNISEYDYPFTWE